MDTVGFYDIGCVSRYFRKSKILFLNPKSWCWYLRL